MGAQHSNVAAVQRGSGPTSVVTVLLELFNIILSQPKAESLKNTASQPVCREQMSAEGQTAKL